MHFDWFSFFIGVGITYAFTVSFIAWRTVREDKREQG
jgi:hypothetical protein